MDGAGKKILGLSAFYHDSAAALLREGRVERAAQEERFSRKKHDPSFPLNAIKFCLAGSSGGPAPDFRALLRGLSCIVFYEKPFLTFERLLESYLRYAPLKGFASFREAMPLWMGKKLNMRALIKKELRKGLGCSSKDIPEILFSSHHLSHAASAFFPSSFQRAAILSLDGVGEMATSSGWLGEGSQIHPLWQINFPHSLGLFYSTFAEYCGFRVNSGEYKLMGLAPYGEPKFVSLIKDHLIDLKEDGSFRLNMDFFDYPARMRMASPRLHQLLGKAPRKLGEEPVGRHYMDAARSVQQVLEEAVFRMAKSLHKETGASSLCLAGGVALNCSANGKLLQNSPFSSLWAQPAAGDAGGSLGAALAVWHQHFGRPRQPEKPDSMKGALLGPEYSAADIEAFLKAEGCPYEALPEEDLAEQAAEALTQGKVIGWLQGKMEFGPRALGCRSILADPRDPDMQRRLNQKIKGRESFRPFAISILSGRIGRYFGEAENPYMLLTAFIRPDQRKNLELNSQKRGLEKLGCVRSALPAVTHVDYSSRIQTVGEEAHPRYQRLIRRFFQKTNCPGIINTSLNVRGEPIVRSPAEALRCFQRTDMDWLILENFVLKKTGPRSARPGEASDISCGQLPGFEEAPGHRSAAVKAGPAGGAAQSLGAAAKAKAAWMKFAGAWNRTVIFLLLLFVYAFVLTPTKYVRGFFFLFRPRRKGWRENSFFQKPDPAEKDHFLRPF